MDSFEIITKEEILCALLDLGFSESAQEGRLRLLECLVKAGAGYKNSHTEEAFLARFSLLRADGTPNSRGRKFICAMLYKHSNNKPEAYYLMYTYRR